MGTLPKYLSQIKRTRNKKMPVISQKGGSVITSNHNYFGVFLYINYTISQQLRQSKF